MKAEPCTLMVSSVQGMGCSSSVDRFEREDPQGVPLLSICRASRWHEDVARSSSSVLLE